MTKPRKGSGRKPKVRNTVKIGDIYYASWGYEQTNIDFLKVASLSPTGMTAICRMMSQKAVDTPAPMTEHVIPNEEYGDPFRLRVKALKEYDELVGSYPYVDGDRRPGFFWVWNGQPVYQSHYH